MISGIRSVTMQYCDTIFGKVISLMILINLIHSVLLSYHTIKYLCLFYFSQLCNYLPTHIFDCQIKWWFVQFDKIIWYHFHRLNNFTKKLPFIITTKMLGPCICCFWFMKSLDFFCVWNRLNIYTRNANAIPKSK